MLIKRGHGEILDIIKDSDENFDDEKTKKTLHLTKNLLEDGNKTESKVEAENN